MSEACHAPIALPVKELSSVSASAGDRRICPLLSAVLDFSPSVLSSRPFHDWLFNSYLTKVNLGQDLLTHINLLLAVVVVVVVVMMVGATMPMPFCTAVAMLVMTMFMMTMMFVMVMMFFLCWCWCIHICGFLALFKLQ